jgi:putative endonuclease
LRAAPPKFQASGLVNAMGPESGDRVRKGKMGEDEAARHLIGKGHRILERNYRFGRCEIDLITMDKETLVFVEVKTVFSGAYGEPEDRVDRRKQRRIGKVASAYLAWKDPGHRDCRFDVVSIVWKEGRAGIRHIEDAFWL